MDSAKERRIEEIQNLLKKKARYCEAFELAKRVHKENPEDIKIAQLYALAMVHLGAHRDAKELLEKIHAEAPDNTETIGLLGRVYKDLWKKSGDEESARRSRDIYLEGFKKTGDYYPGINAASMSLVLGEGQKAKEIAAQIVVMIEGIEPKDYWMLATLGEACLLAGDSERAKEYYVEAVEKTGGGHGELNSSYKQLLFLSKFIDISAEIIEMLKPPLVVAFAGHMIDRPGRKKPRFPESAAVAAKKEIAAALEELNVGIGYTSAACGADILFIEAMLERDAEVNVLLPFHADDFIKTSLAFAGEHWVKRFFNVLERVDSVSFVTEEGYFGNDDVFLFNGYVVQGLSILRAMSLETAPFFLALLDKNDIEKKQGGTGESLDYWPFQENIRIIDTSVLEHETTASQASPPVESQVVYCPQIPFGIERHLKAVLFADVKGFSKLQEEHTPFFMFEFLETLAVRLKSFTPAPEVLNTWGDAIFAVFEGTKNAMEFAIALKELVLETDWPSKGLPEGMTIRIALHSGPVFIGQDPILNRTNGYGAHINRAARMEPVTVPGCIYSSEQFAAKLVVEAKDDYDYEYVGMVALPKGFGMQRIYNVKRK